MLATQETITVGQTVTIIPDTADRDYTDERVGETGTIVATSRGTHADMAMVQFSDGEKEPFYYTELDILEEVHHG
jgi:hypothetical protein